VQNVYPVIYEGYIVFLCPSQGQVIVKDTEAKNYIGSKFFDLPVDFLAVGEDEGNIGKDGDFDYTRSDYGGLCRWVYFPYIFKYFAPGIESSLIPFPP
jgi:hypothetical protein